MSDRSRAAGLGLVELIISTVLLLLLISLILALYLNSHRAYKKSSDHHEVMGDVQVVVSFLTQELEAAPFESVTLDSDGSGISFLTLKDDDGRSNYTEDGRPLWQHWLLYYQSGDALFRLKVPWGAPEITREVPLELPDHSGQPLANFRTGAGRELTDHLEEFHVSNPSGTELIQYRVRLKRVGDVEGVLSLEGALRPRN